jgi:hypothetical protein
MKTSISKKDMRRLQSLQNKTLRLQSGLDRYTPTETLMAATNSLSVHQLAAKSCLVQVYNIQKNKKPAYHYDRLFPEEGIPARIEYDRALCRGGFFFQSSHLWSSLPESIKNCPTVYSFKSKIKKWVQQNISLKL